MKSPVPWTPISIAKSCLISIHRPNSPCSLPYPAYARVEVHPSPIAPISCDATDRCASATCSPGFLAVHSFSNSAAVAEPGSRLPPVRNPCLSASKLGGVGEVLSASSPDAAAPIDLRDASCLGWEASGAVHGQGRGRGGGRVGGLLLAAGIGQVSARPRDGHRAGSPSSSSIRSGRERARTRVVRPVHVVPGLVRALRLLKVPHRRPVHRLGGSLGTGAAGPFLSARRAARIFRRSLRAVASETAA